MGERVEVMIERVSMPPSRNAMSWSMLIYFRDIGTDDGRSTT